MYTFLLVHVPCSLEKVLPVWALWQGVWRTWFKFWLWEFLFFTAIRFGLIPVCCADESTKQETVLSADGVFILNICAHTYRFLTTKQKCLWWSCGVCWFTRRRPSWSVWWSRLQLAKSITFPVSDDVIKWFSRLPLYAFLIWYSN